jgi:hypothetical protein
MAPKPEKPLTAQERKIRRLQETVRTCRLELKPDRMTQILRRFLNHPDLKKGAYLSLEKAAERYDQDTEQLVAAED